MITVVLLFLIGIILILFEVIVPGGILGLLGGLFLLAGTILSFMDYGLTGGLLAFIGCMAVLGVSLVLELKFLPTTRMGKRMFLTSSITDTTSTTKGRDQLLGKTGLALTALSPTGMVLLDGKKYEGFSQSGFLEKGSTVVVDRFDNFRIIVSKKE